jgi:hypothetical protein
MKKLLIPAVAALVLTVGPAWADDSESRTTVEQRTETSGPVLGTQHTRSVETKTQHDDDDDEGTTSVRRDERLTTGSGTMERTTEKRVEHDDD